MPIAAHRILQEAIAAVPAVRYAAGIAGIAAAIAIIASFTLGPAVAVLGVVVMLGLMAALLAFARVAGVGTEGGDSAAGNGAAVRRAGLVIVWVFTLLTCATGVMVFTVTFFGTPRTWEQLVGPRQTSECEPETVLRNGTVRHCTPLAEGAKIMAARRRAHAAP